MTSDAASLRDSRAPLLRWYRKHHRRLPWRRTRDPYAIWISEIMLQQTQVRTVLPYYERFLERFPEVSALAAAPEDAVLAAWSGLGYYRRARSLRAAARQVVACHGGQLPADPAALRSLPGIGRYTAGAIASMAFGLEEPVLDGNVRRVLARRLGRRDPGEAELWELADALVRGTDPGDLNQALMELGALVCTPQQPGCERCPLRRPCVARDSGRPTDFPAAVPRPAVEHVAVGVVLVRRGASVLLERSCDRSPLRGRWDLPARETGAGGDAGAAVIDSLRRDHGLEIVAGKPLGRITHGILHRRLTLQAVHARLRRGRVSGNRELRWIEVFRLEEIPVSGATRKLVALLPARTG